MCIVKQGDLQCLMEGIFDNSKLDEGIFDILWLYRGIFDIILKRIASQIICQRNSIALVATRCIRAYCAKIPIPISKPDGFQS